MIYSLAFGDQPALICDLVDWARTCGFPVVAAGRGHKWLPHFSESTPETVWGNYGLTPEQAQRGGLNPKMFNSFLDGSKPSIESTAVANATGLTRAEQRPALSAGQRRRHPVRHAADQRRRRARAQGHGRGDLLARSRRPQDPLRHPHGRVGHGRRPRPNTSSNCFEEYNAHTDPSGRYFTLYKRWHLIGLEVGMSVASVALRGEATGVATCWNADVVATAKRDLAAGRDARRRRRLHGVGQAAAGRDARCAMGGLPLGLAHNVKVRARR